jgi:hypothetical protein
VPLEALKGEVTFLTDKMVIRNDILKTSTQHYPFPKHIYKKSYLVEKSILTCTPGVTRITDGIGSSKFGLLETT